jgi:hypothetical protein
MPTQTVPAGGLRGACGARLSCAVCLEEFCEGSELRTLPCLHKFHKVRCGVCRGMWWPVTAISKGVLAHVQHAQWPGAATRCGRHIAHTGDV